MSFWYIGLFQHITYSRSCMANKRAYLTMYNLATRYSTSTGVVHPDPPGNMAERLVCHTAQTFVLSNHLLLLCRLLLPHRLQVGGVLREHAQCPLVVAVVFVSGAQVYFTLHFE